MHAYVLAGNLLEFPTMLHSMHCIYSRETYVHPFIIHLGEIVNAIDPEKERQQTENSIIVQLISRRNF